MRKIAVLLTVYNRKNTTIEGLNTLYAAMKNIHDSQFDVFMTNDGCTDGTEEAVHKLFPNIKIINHSGNLFWSRGMNLAWMEANRYNTYDYYIWFNDDAVLFPNSLQELFIPLKKYGNRIIVSGAFHSTSGHVSYGGRSQNGVFIEPTIGNPEIYYMNGNLVLIPKCVYDELGYISHLYKHGYGDWDYGIKARKKNIKVILTEKYVGITDRHDVNIPNYLDKNVSILKRFHLLYLPKNNPIDSFYFNRYNRSILYAIRKLIATHIYTIIPNLFNVK